MTQQLKIKMKKNVAMEALMINRFSSLFLQFKSIDEWPDDDYNADIHGLLIL